MNKVPYVLLSCAMSLDGYLDDEKTKRLILSNRQDLDRVDELRAKSDAILVGANTIRKDNPHLLVRSAARRLERRRKGLSSNPSKVTVTQSGLLDDASSFFAFGDAKKIVYTISSKVGKLKKTFGANATIIGLAGKRVRLKKVLEDLYKSGVGVLMVEGGSLLLTQFLEEGLVDEIQIAIAPFFIGNTAAPRFVQSGHFPWNSQHPMKLDWIKKFGNVAVLRFLLSL